jgi:hypothetical protein
MDKTQILSAFNTHFLEFIADVQRVFPQDKDIATALNSIQLAKKMNPRLIIMAFKEHFATKYRAEILAGDLDFFINNDYNKDLSEIKLGPIGSPSVILEKIDCLREPVKQMPAEEQQKVIKYLQNLTKLCDLYN